MELTGKYQADTTSSFYEFEIDELLDSDICDEIREGASCYEAFWQGKSKTFDNGISIMISFDEADDSDIELIKEHLSEDSCEVIDTIKYDCDRTRF